MKNYQIIAIPPHRIDHVKSAKTCKRIFCGSQNFFYYDFFICFGFRRNLSTERTLKYQLVWQNTIKRVLPFLYLPLRKFVIYLSKRKIFFRENIFKNIYFLPILNCQYFYEYVSIWLIFSFILIRQALMSAGDWWLSTLLKWYCE